MLNDPVLAVALLLMPGVGGLALLVTPVAAMGIFGVAMIYAGTALCVVGVFGVVSLPAGVVLGSAGTIMCGMAGGILVLQRAIRERQ